MTGMASARGEWTRKLLNKNAVSCLQQPSVSGQMTKQNSLDET